MNTSLQSKSRYSVFSEINVTPFVDVMLVLLIIFMVTAPMLQQSLNLSLPETKAIPAKMSKNPFTLKINRNKKIYIGSEAIPLKNISNKLKAIFEARQDKTIYIKADKSVPYEVVAQTLAEIQASGLKDIHLITIAK